MTKTTVKKQSHKNKIVSKSRTKTRTDKTTKQNAGGKKNLKNI